MWRARIYQGGGRGGSGMSARKKIKIKVHDEGRKKMKKFQQKRGKIP